MRHITAAIACVVAALSAASAQQMPDPSQMAGRALPAPELAPGTVSVRLFRERVGNNIVNHPVTLNGLKDGPKTVSTDEQGRAQFSGLAPGTTVTAEAVVDGETLRSQPITVPAAGGVRVALVAGLEAARAREKAEADAAAQAPARPGIVVFGGESRVILEFQDDRLQVFYLLDIVNSARTPITTPEPLVIELPEDAQGAGTMEGSSPLATVQGRRVRIAGPFPPGTTSVQLGYRYPYSGADATIVQKWPAALEQLFVAAEKVGNLQIASPQFERIQESQAGGAPFLMATGGRVNAGDSLTINLSGLPYHNRMLRNVGVGAGLIILAAGLWIATRSRPPQTTQTRQLLQRKEKLFGELVQLEEQLGAGRIDQPKYAARRQGLMTQLERVMGELDRSPDAHTGGGVEGLPA
jgi:hypothetical protein